MRTCACGKLMRRGFIDLTDASHVVFLAAASLQQLLVGNLSAVVRIHLWVRTLVTPMFSEAFLLILPTPSRQSRSAKSQDAEGDS